MGKDLMHMLRIEMLLGCSEQSFWCQLIAQMTTLVTTLEPLQYALGERRCSKVLIRILTSSIRLQLRW